MTTIEALDILNKKYCANCGGDIILPFSECKYCHTKTEGFTEALEYIIKNIAKINDLLTNCNINNVDLFLKVYYLDNFNDMEIDLLKAKASLNIETILDIIHTKLETNQELTEEENLMFQKFLKDPKACQIINYSIVIKSIYKSQKLISKPTFEVFIKKFVEQSMAEINEMYKHQTGKNIKCNSSCRIGKYNMLGGLLGEEIILLDEKTVDDIYNGDIDGMITVSHELWHYRQNMLIKYQKVDDSIMENIKDKVIRRISKHENKPDYYEENYDDYSSEKEARIASVPSLLNYFDSIGLEEISNRYRDALFQQIKQEIANINYNRVINGKIVLKDDIFNLYIKKYPKFLQKYPQLQILYVEENQEVRPKTIDEIRQYFYQHQNEPEIVNFLNFKYHFTDNIKR